MECLQIRTCPYTIADWDFHVCIFCILSLSGEVGDWKNHFTPEQSKMFDEDYQKQMKDVNIPFRALI